jgi:hypothetical protein
MSAEKGMGEYKMNLLQSYIELKLGLSKKANLADRVMQEINVDKVPSETPRSRSVVKTALRSS